MKRFSGMMMLGLVGMAVSGGGPGAQPAQRQAPTGPTGHTAI